MLRGWFKKTKFFPEKTSRERADADCFLIKKWGECVNRIVCNREWEDKHTGLLYIAFCGGLGHQHTKGADGSRYQSIYEPTEPSQPMMSDDVSDEDRPQHRELRPLLFSSHRVICEQGMWDGTYGLSSLSEKTRKSNLLLMSLQRQHILLSYFKVLSVDPARIHDLPLSRQALSQLT